MRARGLSSPSCTAVAKEWEEEKKTVKGHSYAAAWPCSCWMIRVNGLIMEHLRLINHFIA